MDEPAPNPTAGEPIDDRVLQGLARLQRDGRPDIVNRVITLFLHSAAALVKELEEAAASGDTTVLHRASHTLKSASANVGAAVLSAHCKELEVLARNGLGARCAITGRDHRRRLPADPSRSHSASAPGCVMAGSFQRVKPLILIADDQETERFLLREVLEPAGFDIVEAGGGPAALRLFAECMPDLVVLDVMMPGLNGFDVCQAIRSLPGGRNAPVLMATALDDIESIDRAYRVGATDFIGKPINWPVLPHRVRYMLRAHQTLQNLIVSERRLAEAQRIAGLGNFRWLPHTASIECSAELCRMFGLGDRARSVSARSLLRRIHAADRSAVMGSVRRGLAGGQDRPRSSGRAAWR